MSKIIMTFIALACVATTVYGQQKYDIIVGKNIAADSDIKATQYAFDERIHNYFFDGNNRLFIELLGKSNDESANKTGLLVSYDFNSAQKLWSTESISWQDCIINNKDVSIKSNPKESSRINPETGEVIWRAKNVIIYYIDPTNNIALGYNAKKRNMLQGINLSDRSVVWERNLDREFGWNDTQMLNDSTILITSSGLHMINLRNGKGWDYNAVTGDSDYTAVVGITATGVTLDAITGIYGAGMDRNAIGRLVSNTLVDNDCIYLADSKYIACFDLYGNNKWLYVLGDHIAGNSEIFLRGDTLYMINNGGGVTGKNNTVKYGRPFLAAWNKDTGENIYFEILTDKRAVMSDYSITSDNDIKMIVDDKISVYSMNDGSLVSEASIKNCPYGKVKYFAYDNIYLKDGDYYRQLTSNSDYYYLAGKDRVFVLDKDFVPVEEIIQDQLYTKYLTLDGFSFLSQGSQTIIIDSNNEEFAKLNLSNRTRLVGNKLYDVLYNNLIEIDVEELFCR